jgi:hypothetical protein
MLLTSWTDSPAHIPIKVRCQHPRRFAFLLLFILTFFDTQTIEWFDLES